MTSREVKKEKMGDDPPYLAVGTDVSAKYKGAFCEAKVRKVVRVVKCKVLLKNGGSAFVTDDQIKGNLRIGTTVEVKLTDKKELVEASIVSIKDLSQYTVVFDDGDITTLRRTALCLKSGRHFAESETLDQLPLTHPEHFSTPVMGGPRRGRRRPGNEDSSDEEGSTKEKQKEVDIGKVVCVEISEKKKQKDNWFPGLIVAPNAQDAVRIDVDEDYLVRSFKDGRYFTVPKKEATEFTREIGLKVDNPTLKLAVEKALLFLDKDDLPPHWDRDLLFGLVESDIDEDSDQLDSESSDDEPREEKDHFVAQLYKFMDDRGTPINKGPVIASKDVDLYKLFRVVHKMGGYNRVTNHNQWKLVTHKMSFSQNMATVNSVKLAYKKFLHSFEDFYRKLGCTMVNHPRGNRRSNKSNRSLIRDKDRATPVIKENDREKTIEPSTCVVEIKDGGREEREVRVELKKEEETPRREERRIKKEDDSSKKSRKEEDVRKDKTNKKEEEIKKEKKKEREVKKEDEHRRDKLVIKEVKEEKKEEPMITLAKKKIEETFKINKDIGKPKTDDKPKSSIGILAKFSYKKDKQPTKDRPEDKDRLNKVRRTLQMKGSGGLMERQKRSITEKMKSFAKSLGFGKSNSGTVGATTARKISVSGSGEDEEKKKKQVEEPIVSIEKKRVSSCKSKEESPSASTPLPSQIKLRKNSTTAENAPCVRSSKKSSDEDTLSPDSSKKSNRLHRTKKKEDDEGSSHSENSEQLPLDVVSPQTPISVGDKLKVYYGPNHKSKVTYEAKVMSTREEDGTEMEYLVHYTGWNIRYDEWIKRNRIAENLTWAPSRSSKRISVNKPPTESPSQPPSMRPNETTSTGTSTPSSSSKAKPLVRRPSSRNLNKPPNRPSTRSARTNTDDSDSGKDSDSDESENEEISGSNRSMRSRRIRSDLASSLSDEDKKIIKRKHKLARTGEDGDDEDEGDDDKPKGDESVEKQNEEEENSESHEVERKSLRLSQRKNKEREIEKRLCSDSDSEGEDEIKATVLEIIEPKGDTLDDVYEFKEPEPFDFNKQKKTISPPGKKSKKSIGLFEDYDNTDEETDDPISAAIQRVMDSELDSSTENEIDMDLLEVKNKDKASSDSSCSGSGDEQTGSSMFEMIKKRFQSEINTYEGPKSKSKIDKSESVRTRKSSETSNENVKSKKSDSSFEKLKPRHNNDNTEKNENSGSFGKSKTSKADIDSAIKLCKNTEKESEISKYPTSSNKKDSVNVENVKQETPKIKSKILTPESMKTRFKNDLSRSESPGSKTRSRTDLKKIEEQRKSPEPLKVRQKIDMSSDLSKEDISKCKLESMLVESKLTETPLKPKTKTDSFLFKSSTEKDGSNIDTKLLFDSQKKDGDNTKHKLESSTTSNLSENIETVGHIKKTSKDTPKDKSLNKGKDTEQNKTRSGLVQTDNLIEQKSKSESQTSVVSKLKNIKPTVDTKSELGIKPCDSSKLTTSRTKNPPPSGFGKTETSFKPKLKTKPLPKTEFEKNTSFDSDTLKVNSKSDKSHMDSSIQTEFTLGEDEPSCGNTSLKSITGVKISSDEHTCMVTSSPKAQKAEFFKGFSGPSNLTTLNIDFTTSKSTDIPILQKIEKVVPKTPIKCEIIDPNKIDLIKISPSMPQLEKIDAYGEIITPTKKDDTGDVKLDQLKKTYIKFDDITETPEKLFVLATDQDDESKNTPNKSTNNNPNQIDMSAISPSMPPLEKIKPPSEMTLVKRADVNLIQTSPCMPPLEKIHAFDKLTTSVPKEEINSVGITPIKKEENSDIYLEQLKVTHSKLESTSETPEKVIVLGMDKDDEKKKIANKTPDSKIEFKMKPKSSSPSFGRARKLIRHRPGDSPKKNDKKEMDLNNKSKEKNSKIATPTPSNKFELEKPIAKTGEKLLGFDNINIDKSSNSGTISKTESPNKNISSKIRVKSETDSKEKTKDQKLLIEVGKTDVRNLNISDTIQNTIESVIRSSSESVKTQVERIERVTNENQNKIKKEINDKKKDVTLLGDDKPLNKANSNKDKVKEMETTPDIVKKENITKANDDSKDKKELKTEPESPKKEEKSKEELSSVFEFDETLEDDIESESYILKRKIHQLESSPLGSSNSEFMKSKMQKLNELEKLKQKLFLDSSGENEELLDSAESKVHDEQSKSEYEAYVQKEEEDKLSSSSNVQETGDSNEKKTDETLSVKAEETLEEEEEVDNALLCKETIPGSPTPYQDELNLIMELPSTSNAIAVMDNTPPTTPDSSLSSPRDGSSPPSAEKCETDSAVYTKILSDESPRKSGMKRRSSHNERTLKKRIKQSPRTHTGGSDSDEHSLSESFSIMSFNNDLKSKYFIEFDPKLDQAQKIAVIQQKLQDLRKEYVMYKQELVSIDRRRKKIRRRERELKKNNDLATRVSPPVAATS